MIYFNMSSIIQSESKQNKSNDFLIRKQKYRKKDVKRKYLNLFFQIIL